VKTSRRSEKAQGFRASMSMKWDRRKWDRRIIELFQTKQLCSQVCEVVYRAGSKSGQEFEKRLMKLPLKNPIHQ
jgi:hypothetical protein